MIGNEDWPWRRLSKTSLIDAQTSTISSNGDTILVQEFLHTTVSVQPVFYSLAVVIIICHHITTSQ